jgi:two-component system response regulator YesN
MCRIMITDQNKMIGQWMIKRIKSSRIRLEKIITCSHASEALEYLHDNDIDIVFTRIEKNDRMGVDFAGTIKKARLFTIVVGYGSCNDFNFLLRAMSSGISYYLSNIYDIKEFMVVLGKAYEQYRRMKMEVKLKAEEEKGHLEKSLGSSFLNEWTANFCRNAIENNTDAVNTYIDFFCSVMEKQPLLSTKRMIIEMFVMLANYLEKDGTDLPVLPTKAKDYNMLISLSSLEQVKEWFIKRMRNVARVAGEMFNAENAAYKLMLALSYISNNYHKDISRDDIANQIHLNPSYFSHLFKAQMGQSFVEYLRQIRIEKAKYLLEFTDDYPVYLKVGYNSSKYFAKVFRQQTGYTPSEYKKMVSGCAAACAQ